MCALCIGYAVVTETEAALWTDGRYLDAADQQMDCNWILSENSYNNNNWPFSTHKIVKSAINFRLKTSIIRPSYLKHTDQQVYLMKSQWCINWGQKPSIFAQLIVLQSNCPCLFPGSVMDPNISWSYIVDNFMFVHCNGQVSSWSSTCLSFYVGPTGIRHVSDRLKTSYT